MSAPKRVSGITPLSAASLWRSTAKLVKYAGPVESGAEVPEMPAHNRWWTMDGRNGCVFRIHIMGAALAALVLWGGAGRVYAQAMGKAAIDAPVAVSEAPASIPNAPTPTPAVVPTIKNEVAPPALEGEAPTQRGTEKMAAPAAPTVPPQVAADVAEDEHPAAARASETHGAAEAITSDLAKEILTAPEPLGVAPVAPPPTNPAPAAPATPVATAAPASATPPPAHPIEREHIQQHPPEKSPDSTTTAGTHTSAVSLPAGVGNLGQVAAALAIVIGLIFIGKAMVKKIVPGANVAPGKGVIEVLARHPLAKNQSIVLVRIGSQIVALNQGKDASESVLVISDATEVAKIIGQIEGRNPDSSQAGFTKLLANARMDLEQNPAEEDLRTMDPQNLDDQLEEMAAAKRQLMELRQHVRSVRDSMPRA